MQAELNIGTMGHVDHGKTTLVHALTGKWTDTHSQELKRGITIKLGYAEFEVKKCVKCSKLTVDKKCKCGGETQLVRKVSLVDAPGHETLMATVIAASSIIDGVLFLIAANEECPQPQTAEHLMIIEAAGIKNAVVIQNKVDLVSKEQAKKNYAQIKALLKGSLIENAPIIPVVANSSTNFDSLLEAVQEFIPTPVRDEKEGSGRMMVVRSFDVNKPGSEISKLNGGVLGGAVIRGKIKAGDEIEILPGFFRQKQKKETYEPIKTKVVKLHAGKDALDEAGPGGLIAVATLLDPSLSKADSLVGCLAGPVGSLPPVSHSVTVEVTAMPRLIQKFAPTFAQNEPLVLGAGTSTTVGFIDWIKKKNVHLVLKKPICVEKGDKIAVMRRSSNRWHVYGTAKVTALE